MKNSILAFAGCNVLVTSARQRIQKSRNVTPGNEATVETVDVIE
jgi:hypothetical protein